MESGSSGDVCVPHLSLRRDVVLEFVLDIGA